MKIVLIAIYIYEYTGSAIIQMSTLCYIANGHPYIRILLILLPTGLYCTISISYRLLNNAGNKLSVSLLKKVDKIELDKVWQEKVFN